jgi:hypothetical protein
MAKKAELRKALSQNDLRRWFEVWEATMKRRVASTENHLEGESTYKT